MTMRHGLGLGLVCLTVMAAAQGGVLAEVQGRGQAFDRTDQPATFGVRAVKTEQGVRGEFSFQTRSERPGHTVEIKMTQTGRLGFRDKAATFTGSAVLQVKDPRGEVVEQFRGTVVVSMNDLTAADTARDRADSASVRGGEQRVWDTISVVFESPQTDRTLEYRGRVVKGDLVVRPGL